MRELQGNLWTLPCDGRAITTNLAIKANGEAVMGRGCAAEAKAFDPELPRILAKANALGLGCALLRHRPPKPPLFSFTVKHHWREAADLELIAHSAEHLQHQAEEHDLHELLLPRPGCGNGRLSWDDVRPVIEPLLSDRIVVVTF